MLIAIPFSFSRPVKASLANWLPWSVLKISGFSFLERASSSASIQKLVSMVIERRQSQNPAAEPVHHSITRLPRYYAPFRHPLIFDHFPVLPVIGSTLLQHFALGRGGLLQFLSASLSTCRR